MPTVSRKTMSKMDKVKLVILEKSKTSEQTAGASPKAKKKAKKNALVICRDESRFWITQKQFWQWFREKKILKTGDRPLTGKFVSRNEEKMIVLANTILNISCPNHLREAMEQRRLRKKQ